jgi:hypothetical protein
VTVRRYATALLASLAAVVLPGAGPATAAPRAASIGGNWTLTFTPDSVRTVGKMLRSGDQGFDCKACQSQYQFTEAGAGGGRTALLSLPLPAEGCAAAPCDITVAPSAAGGFAGTVHWDGTTYTLKGQSFESSQCKGLLPEGTDTGSFTLSGDELTGTLTALLGWTATNDCSRLVGYEVYTGPFVGKQFGFRPGATGVPPGALPGGPVSLPVRDTAYARRHAVADHVAAVRHDRPSISTGVADARSLPWSPKALLVSALLALLLVLVMPFPAALFNATLEANYDEVRRWFRFLPHRPDPEPEPEPAVEPEPAAEPAAAAAATPARRWRDLAVFSLLAAVLNAFLDPHLRFDRASLVLVAGLALSVATVSLLASVPARRYVRRVYHDRAHVRLYPIGLGVAAVCVLVSRLTHFEPGYLYGVVAGFAFARELGLAEKGWIAFATSAFLLVVALAAFALRVPVHAHAVRSDAVLWALADTVLAAVFAAGVEANVLGLLPLRFLPGEQVIAWRRAAWMAAFGFSVFAFLHALSAQAGEARTGASVAVAAGLFLVFGAVSVTFWAYFRYRPSHPTPASV